MKTIDTAEPGIGNTRPEDWSDEPTPEPGSNLLAGLRTGDWLDTQQFAPLRWVVPGVLPEGMTLLVGGPKIGKSWMSLGIALAAASGGRALGTLPTGKPRPVLLLALEDGDRRLQERARELLEGAPIPPRLHYLTRVEPGMILATIEIWLDKYAAGVDDQPVVILDTLGKVMPPAMAGESAYQRDYRVAGQLKRIADQRPGMALPVLHHDRKATSEDFVDGVSGTNGIAGAADTIIVVSRSRNETTGLLKVTGRDVPEGEYAVTITGGRWRLDGADLGEAARHAQVTRVSGNLGDRSTDILRFAAGCPAGFGASDVAAALDIGDDVARTYLQRLAKAGRLNHPARGLYTPVSSVMSVPFPAQNNTHITEQTGGLGGKKSSPSRCPDGFAQVQHPEFCQCNHLFKEIKS